MVGLVGVQSNQYPRAMDVARRLRQLGVQVCIGGFHVSGTLAMLPEMPPELREAQALGISLFAGEAEGRLDQVLRDAWNGALKPLYNYMDDLPGLEGTPVPILPAQRVQRTTGHLTSFDAGRGNLFKKGVAMDPDLNKYDLQHVLTAHPKMSKPEWDALYQRAWSAFYSDDHIETLLRRATATGISAGKTLFLLMWFYGSVFAEKVHPLQGGYFRLKSRRDRRPPLPLENPLVFYPRYVAELATKHVHMARVIWKFARIRSALRRDPNAKAYMDQAITPVADDELDTLEMFGINDSAKAAVIKARREEQARARIGA